ncbi:hypothetical protein [Plantactinospora veratri]
MLITPMPGVHRNNLRQSLVHLHQAVVNIRGGATNPAMHPVFPYLDWANEVRRQLGTQISASSLNALVPPDRYQLLMSAAASLCGKPDGADMVLNSLLAVELDERTRAFEDAIAGLDDQVKRFERTSTATAVSGVSVSSVVAKSGLVLASSAPSGPGPDLFCWAGSLHGQCGEQASDLRYGVADHHAVAGDGSPLRQGIGRRPARRWRPWRG